MTDDPLALLAWAGLLYVALDIVLGIALGRCVLPGLKCRSCKKYGDHQL